MAALVPTWLWILIFYLVLAIVTVGRYAIVHPRTVCACQGADPTIYMWSMLWWPHAISHGLNPFVTHYVWSPNGVNVAKITSMPTVAILTTPITAAFGPIFSYNLVSIASPALTAFTTYLLCRRIVKRELPAVVGGFLFGFSAYEFGQLLGHLNLVTIFLIPVMGHITLRRLDRELSRRAYVLWMALLLALQMGLSTELLAESVMLGLILLLTARLVSPKPYRARIAGLTGEVIVAGLVTVVITSPFLYYALVSGGFPPASPDLANMWGLDLANLFFPTSITWLGHNDFLALSATFEYKNLSEAGGYLGVAIILGFLTWFFSGAHRTALGRLLAVTVAISVVLALGAHLHVASIETIALPFNAIKGLPLFDNLIPSRLMLFATLAVSIGIAAWVAKSGGHASGRWIVALVGVAMIFPNVERTSYGTTPTNPPFFTTGIYKHYLRRNETVLILPFSWHDMSMLWQAETHFYFYMPEGYVSAELPSQFATQPAVAELFANTPASSAALLAFLRMHYVSHVIVDPALAGVWAGVLAQAGLRGREVGGVILYDVPRD